MNREDDTPLEVPRGKFDDSDASNGRDPTALNFELLHAQVKELSLAQAKANEKMELLADLMRSAITHIEGVRTEMNERFKAYTDSVLAAIQEKRP